MKKLFAILMLMSLLMAITGCRSSKTPNAGDQNAQTQNSTLPTSTVKPNIDPTTPTRPDPTPTLPSGNIVLLEQAGSLRIDYTADVHSVQYITDASQLPGYDEFDQYDAVFFESHALLLVTETVGSGSTRIELKGYTCDGNDAHIKLLYNSPEVSTADMATWLIWAVVDANLPYEWHIPGQTANPEN